VIETTDIPFFETQLIKVKQPLGEFYVASIPARILLNTSFSKKAFATKDPSETTYSLSGAQREKRIKRLKAIGLYINRDDSAFPNSIILAANFSEEEYPSPEERGLTRYVRDESVRWRIEEDIECSTLKLIIPKPLKMAQIIDGQHRVFGFEQANPERLDSELLCSIFFDLPEPIQAQLFATINSNQKPVDRSLTYELFGYNIEDEPAEFWGPDKLAVFLARKLNTENESPLKERILVSAENEFALSRSDARKNGRWMISMATVVDGILRLISKNVDEDYSILSEKKGKDRESLREDSSPLRDLYIQENDKLLYALLVNYFTAVKNNIWDNASEGSFVIRTVGFQATLDILQKYLSIYGLEQKKFSVNFFNEYLEKAATIDFSDNFFKNASGSGRIVIRNCLELAMGFKELSDMNKDQEDYKRVCNL